MDFKIISFYTNDWEYPAHANRLKEECELLGLDYCIEERPSTTDYIKNTAIKPFFIRDCIEKFKQPVIWIDVDALILKPINFVIDADIHACKHKNSHVSREWAVAFLAFNYTTNSLNFINAWCNHSNKGTDENAFELAWQELKDCVEFKTLPSVYHFVKWSNSLEIPEDTIICHQLSKFEDKLRRKSGGKLNESAE